MHANDVVQIIISSFEAWLWLPEEVINPSYPDNVTDSHIIIAK